jgi:hypothetical protein
LREWLVRSGIFVDLRIGVQKYDEQLIAHAWLEYSGKVLNDNGKVVATYSALQADRGKLLSQLLEACGETVQ